MKKLIALLMCTLLFATVCFQALAKEDVISQESQTVTATATPKISYNLPYPGMLPDSPLYKLKVLRDKVILFLISDPKKKIDFYLLQADKGILASAMLVEKGNIQLAQKTALKAEHNMTLIPEQIRLFQAKPQNEMFEKLIRASKKHQEILAMISEKVKGDEKQTFQTVFYFSKENLSTIEKYQRKNPRKWNEWN